MEEAQYKINDHIVKSISGELQENEQQELDVWMNEAEDNRRFFDDITDDDNLKNELKEYHEAGAYAAIVQQRVLEICFKESPMSPSRYSWLKLFAIAASLVLVFSIMLYFLVNPLKPSTQIVTNQKTSQQQVTTDVPPGAEKATLTLADGRRIVLDSAGFGQIAQQGNTIINNTKGKLEYKAPAHKETAILYNTLTTANGETYQVILPDGSKVWLNAASSIRYPVVFTGKERRVAVTGEAYFEIEKDINRPFYVSIADNTANTEKALVKVLGTHFNINAYDDEPVIKTTLLEGSVTVTAGKKQEKIIPGQQAIISLMAAPDIHSKVIKVTTDVDTGQVVDWKEGNFNFNNCDLKTVMRQIARWYNLQVVYPAEIPNDKFWGKIHRNTKASGLLLILNKSSRLHFIIEDKKIIVKL